MAQHSDDHGLRHLDHGHDDQGFGFFRKFIFGTAGDDELHGTDRGDWIFGFRGGDLADGDRGNDKLFGGRGNDGLVGSKGNDHLFGGPDNDLIVGGPGHDKLVGGDDNDTFLFRKGMGIDIIAHLDDGDRIDVRDFGLASFQALVDASKQAGHDVTIDLGGSDKIVIQDAHLSDLKAEQFIVSDEVTGPSSSQAPYLASSDSHVYTQSLLTVGDSVGGYSMVGIPDGLGAYDNGDGTFTVLMNHELGATAGAVRAHGATGAFVSQWVIDKTTLEVMSGQDLIQRVFTYDAATDSYVEHSASLGNGEALGRLCSADLPDAGAFFNPATGLGYNGGRLFLDGEEVGPEGRAFAHIATGTEAGTSYELAWLGNLSYENILANAHTGDKTIAGILDDSLGGQVYFYAGDKKATGSAIDMAGLTGGHVFGLKIDEFSATPDSSDTNPLGADNVSGFSLVDLGDVSGMTGAELEAASQTADVSSFLRPEDGSWDVLNPNRFYFVTTNAVDMPTQLWAVDFIDAANPSLGGTVRLLLNGNENGADHPQMFDNMTVNAQGKVILQEDVGNNAHLGKVWEYDPTTDTLSELAQHDPTFFQQGGADFLTQDEESSGIIDVSDILGSAGHNVYLADTQAHFAIPGELVEGGQLQLIHQYLV
jgi:hypothetical protein